MVRTVVATGIRRLIAHAVLTVGLGTRCMSLTRRFLGFGGSRDHSPRGPDF
jgi:hypothetical protein